MVLTEVALEYGGLKVWRVVRNGSKDGLAVSVAFRSIVCPFLYTVKVMLFPGPSCSSLFTLSTGLFDVQSSNILITLMPANAYVKCSVNLKY